MTYFPLTMGGKFYELLRVPKPPPTSGGKDSRNVKMLKNLINFSSNSIYFSKNQLFWVIFDQNSGKFDFFRRQKYFRNQPTTMGGKYHHLVVFSPHGGGLIWYHRFAHKIYLLVGGKCLEFAPWWGENIPVFNHLVGGKYCVFPPTMGGNFRGFSIFPPWGSFVGDRFFPTHHGAKVRVTNSVSTFPPPWGEINTYDHSHFPQHHIRWSVNW